MPGPMVNLAVNREARRPRSASSPPPQSAGTAGLVPAKGSLNGTGEPAPIAGQGMHENLIPTPLPVSFASHRELSQSLRQTSVLGDFDDLTLTLLQRERKPTHLEMHVRYLGPCKFEYLLELAAVGHKREPLKVKDQIAMICSISRVPQWAKVGLTLGYHIRRKFPKGVLAALLHEQSESNPNSDIGGNDPTDPKRGIPP